MDAKKPAGSYNIMIWIGYSYEYFARQSGGAPNVQRFGRVVFGKKFFIAVKNIIGAKKNNPGIYFVSRPRYIVSADRVDLKTFFGI